jgi:hypothetical protein
MSQITSLTCWQAPTTEFTERKSSMSKRIPFPYIYRVKSRADMQAGARGNHKCGMIDIRDDQGAPVLAQEIMEEDFLMVRCHIPNAIAGAALGAYAAKASGGVIGSGASAVAFEPWQMLAFCVPVGIAAALVFGYLFWRTVIGPITGWHRLMEYRGHMATFWMQTRLRLRLSQLDHIARDLSHYDQFKGMSLEEIEAGLDAQSLWAMNWIDANREFVEAKADALGLRGVDDA